MHHEDDGDILNFLAGLAVGALLGAAVGLLLAPGSGRRTRRKIVRAVEDLGEATGERLHDARGEVRRAAVDARRTAERSQARLRERIGRS